MNKKLLTSLILIFFLGLLVGYITLASPGPKPNPGHSWSEIGDFPSPCPAGQFVTAIGGSLTCTAPAGSWSTCDASHVGELRYYTACSIEVGKRSARLAVCMQRGSNSYAWYVIRESDRWDDPDCGIIV